MGKAPTPTASNGSTVTPSPYGSYSATPSNMQSSYTHNSNSQPNSSAPGQPSSAPGTAQIPQQPMYFGVDLGYQMARDGVDIPKVLEKCAEVIEMYGLDITGLYRLSGTTSRIQRLKAKFEKGESACNRNDNLEAGALTYRPAPPVNHRADIDAVNLHSDENLTDINDISGVLKLFFRELPEPLFTHELYHGFIEAARKCRPVAFTYHGMSLHWCKPLLIFRHRER